MVSLNKGAEINSLVVVVFSSDACCPGVRTTVVYTTTEWPKATKYSFGFSAFANPNAIDNALTK